MWELEENALSARWEFEENGHWYKQNGKRFVFQHSESLKKMDTGKHGIDTAEK
jgi:hypothetical protein